MITRQKYLIPAGFDFAVSVNQSIRRQDIIFKLFIFKKVYFEQLIDYVSYRNQADKFSAVHYREVPYLVVVEFFHDIDNVF